MFTPESEVAEGKPESSAGEGGGADRAAEAGETESAGTGGTAHHLYPVSTDAGQGTASVSACTSPD